MGLLGTEAQYFPLGPSYPYFVLIAVEQPLDLEFTLCLRGIDQIRHRLIVDQLINGSLFPGQTEELEEPVLYLVPLARLLPMAANRDRHSEIICQFL
jgi:hypothetical protein